MPATANANRDVAAFIGRVEALTSACDRAFQQLDEIVLNSPTPSSVLPLALVAKARCSQAAASIGKIEVPARFADKVQTDLSRWTAELEWVAKYRSMLAEGATFYARENEPRYLLKKESLRRDIKITMARGHDGLLGAKEAAGLTVRPKGDAAAALKSYMASADLTVEPCHAAFNEMHQAFMAEKLRTTFPTSAVKDVCAQADYTLGLMLPPRTIAEPVRDRLKSWISLTRTVLDKQSVMGGMAGLYIQGGTKYLGRPAIHENYTNLVVEHAKYVTAAREALAEISNKSSLSD